MPVNTRVYWALGWGCLAAFVLIVQLVEIISFDNRLQHFTNWAWLFYGVLAGLHSFYGDTVPIQLTLIAFSVSTFVASGITCIMIMDNTMIEQFEKESGAFIVTLGNIIFHYIPWGLLLIDLYINRKMVKVYILDNKISTYIIFIIMQSSYFIYLYSTWFDVRDEYPGDGIDYIHLFIASTSIMVVGFAIPTSFALL